MIRRIALAASLLLGALCLAGEARAQTFSPCDPERAFPELHGTRCVMAKAPLDHARPDAGQVDLFVRKFPAVASRRGQIWLIAGGPGESGAAFYPFLDTLRRAFPHHDLMIPDHRGTGDSTRLCPAQEAIASPDGMGLAGEEWGPCIGAFYQDPARAHAFTITNAARDLALLIGRYRDAGEVQVYGVSYGTQLVLRMMQVAPPAVDGVILDGLIPLGSDPAGDLGRRTVVVDAVGRALLDAEQEAAYAALLAGATPDTPWLARVPGGDLRRFMGTLLNFPGLRERIPAIVHALSRGDAAEMESAQADLVARFGAFGRYPQSSPSLPLVMLISGSENNARRDLDPSIVAAEAGDALFLSPLPGFLASNPLPLYDRDEWFDAAPPTLPRTLVIHGTLDPNTLYESAATHVARLRETSPVQLATVEGGAHFLLFAAPQCFIDAAGAFVGGADAPATCDGDDAGID